VKLVNNQNQLTIIFNKALKGKKVQIEPYRNKPDIDQSKKAGGYDYIKSTTIKAEAAAKITKLDTTKLWLETQCDDCTKKDKEFLNGSFFKLKAISWYNPLEKMELRGWYTSTQWTPIKSSYGGRTGGKHSGLDLYAPVGTSCYACVEGFIYDDYTSTSYGKTITIKGKYKGTTYYFFYAHLSSRNVKKNDYVKIGDLIGKTGQSGNANGQAAKMAHLHFEIRTKGTKIGNKANPSNTVIELRKSLITNPEKTEQI